MTQSTNEINPLTGEPIGTYSKSEPFADFSDYNGPETVSYTHLRAHETDS